MVTEEKSVTRSIRGDKEVFQRLADLAKEKGMQQGAALEALLNAWDVQNAKGLVPERAADIADFDAHLQGIQKAFLRSLDLASSAEDRARVGYSAQLDAMSGTVARLEKELADARNTNAQIANAAHKERERAERAEKRVAELEKRVAELEAAQAEKAQTEALLTAVQALLEQKTDANANAEKPSKKKTAKSPKTLTMEQNNGTTVSVNTETGEMTIAEAV